MTLKEPEGLHADRHAGQAARHAGQGETVAPNTASTPGCRAWELQRSPSRRCSAASRNPRTKRQRAPSRACARSFASTSAVAVVADHMGAAKKGLEAAAIQWDDGPNATLSTADIVRQLEEASKQPGVVARHVGDVDQAFAGAAQRIDATYQMPFLAHAAMEPMNCTVHVSKDGCDIWVGTQAPGLMQATVAELTGLPKEAVRIHNHLLGGGFGRRLDVDGAVLAVKSQRRSKGRSRSCGAARKTSSTTCIGPTTTTVLSAGLDADGKPVAWTHRVCGSSVSARYRAAALQGRRRPRCGGRIGAAALRLAEHPCRLCAGRAAGYSDRLLARRRRHSQRLRRRELHRRARRRGEAGSRRVSQGAARRQSARACAC